MAPIQALLPTWCCGSFRHLAACLQMLDHRDRSRIGHIFRLAVEHITQEAGRRPMVKDGFSVRRFLANIPVSGVWSHASGSASSRLFHSSRKRLVPSVSFKSTVPNAHCRHARCKKTRLDRKRPIPAMGRYGQRHPHRYKAAAPSNRSRILLRTIGL